LWVPCNIIKAGITWTGPIGLNIFDAVDEIFLAFLEGVDKVLPKAGKVLIKRNSTVYSGLSPIDACWSFGVYF